MTKEFKEYKGEIDVISFKTAELLYLISYSSDIIFNTPKVYFGSGGLFDSDLLSYRKPDVFYPAPTQSLLQKWLREKHNIDVSVLPGWVSGKRIYECVLWDNSYDKDVKLSIMDEHGSTYEYKYETALEEGLYQALLLIK